MKVFPKDIKNKSMWAWHVFETPKVLFINGMGYNKRTLEPMLNCCFDYYDSNDAVSHFNLMLLCHSVNVYETNYYGCGMAWTPTDYNYIQDSSDENVFYFIEPDANAGYYQYQVYISKVRIDKDGQYRRIYARNYPGGSHYGYNNHYVYGRNYKYLAQNKDYICFATGISGYDYYGYIPSPTGRYSRKMNFSIIRFSKLGTQENELSTSEPYIQTYFDTNDDCKLKNDTYYGCADWIVEVIKQEDVVLWIYMSVDGGFRILKYNMETNYLRILYEEMPAEIVGPNAIGLSNVISYKGHYCCMSRSTTENAWIIKQFDVDYDTDTVTVKDYPINNVTGLNFLTRKDGYNNEGYYWSVGFPVITLQNINDNHIWVTVHNKGNQFCYVNNTPNNSYNLYMSRLGHHRCIIIKKIDGEDAFTEACVAKPDRDTQHIYGVLYLDLYHQVTVFDDHISVHRFNQANETITELSSLHGFFWQVGTDEYNHLYAIKNADQVATKYKYKVFIYRPDDPFECWAKMEGDKELVSYEYKDQLISTYCIVCVKSLHGAYLRRDVKLIITGNAYFNSTSTNTMTMTSSASGTTRVNITINGPGSVFVNVEVLED